jgi:UDP-2,4-diacetamido-2,4,6-trideoxy-beta-L-altropyranose hydrolase
VNKILVQHKTKTNILIRVNSSSSIGTGHIKRDLVLAQKYHKKGFNIFFATQNFKGNINDEIIQSGYQLINLKSNSKKELKSTIIKYNIDMVVFDSYDIDNKYEKYIKKHTKVKILSFDDIYKKHHCDILLNHNLGANKKRYKHLVPKNCIIKCGVKYTLLRDEFKKQKNKSDKKIKKPTLFIAMGGADSSNLNIKILKVLKQFDNLYINIVSTNANKKLNVLKQYCKNKRYIKLHINSNNIAKLMKNSSLAIVTPSVVLNEVYFMNLPFIAIKTASNQKELYRYLKKNQKNVLKKFDKNKFYKIIQKEINI